MKVIILISFYSLTFHFVASLFKQVGQIEDDAISKKNLQPSIDLINFILLPSEVLINFGVCVLVSLSHFKKKNDS